MPGGGRVTKISIIPRGSSALGYTLKMPTEDRFLVNEQELHQQIAMLLGGRAAEALIFETVTNGASDDLQRATDIAEQMVTLYGMSHKLGPLAYNKAQGRNFLSNGNGSPRRPHSEETGQVIDAEVRKIVDAGYQQAIAILQHNRPLLDEIATQLLNVEVIEGDQLAEFLNRVEPLPASAVETEPLSY